MAETDYTPRELANLDKMHSLLERLQVCAEMRVEAMERMKIAETGLEMQRQTRAIKSIGDLVIHLYEPRGHAKRTSRPAEAKAPKPPKPSPKPSEASVLGELQLISKLLDKTSALKGDEPTSSSPPKAKTVAHDLAPALEPSPAEPVVIPEPSPQQQLDGTLEKTQARINEVVYRCAKWAGVWPDGELFSLEDADWRSHTGEQPLKIDPDGDEAAHTQALTTETLRRCNAIARHVARDMGCWLDAQPYSENDPDFWSLSANMEAGFASGDNRRADNEKPSPRCLPWWIVRVPRDEPPGSGP